MGNICNQTNKTCLASVEPDKRENNTNYAQTGNIQQRRHI
uniref:Uncharacterized protein n=1 Tax=Arundo donax TaxID=35708 RepID=A0A0A9CIJ8_ARUDO